MPMSIEPSGVHITVEGHDAPRQLLSNRAYLYTVLEDLPKVIGMGAVADPRLTGSGAVGEGSLSGFVMNGDSHISFHAVPASGFVSVDFYTCREIADRQGIIELLTSSFALRDAYICVKECGPRQPGQNLLAA
jgi:S-adenosylmethionine decarboxylase